ncbi:13539_t:CDS:2, partial [Funneliformis caledonium]
MSSYSSLSRVLSPFRVQTKIEENSLPARSNVIHIRYTMAYYLVLGEVPIKRKLDFVKFDFSGRVMILRNAIYDKKKNTFSSKSIDESDLILWKVDIPFDGENDKLMMLDERFDTINIEQDLEGKKMLPGDEISKYLKNFDKPSSSIHILGKEDTESQTWMKKAEPKKKINEHVTKTLASLLTSSILQPHITNIPSHKFYDRDQALHSMLEVARFNYCHRKSPDYKDHKFVLIPGGIGIGKTRMGWETKNMLDNLTRRNDDTDEFVKALKNPYYFSIDLNNGCKYIPGFDDKVSASVRIGSRVAMASGLVSEKLSDLSKMNVELFYLSAVIYEIFKRRPKQRSVEAIIIHLDEYQLYINDVQQYQQLSWTNSRDFFISMLREIGSVMRGNMMIPTESGHADYELNGKYFIILICTGTSAIDVHFLPTEHTQVMLELKPLNYASAKSMFLDKYDYLKQTTDEGRDLVVQGLKSHYCSDLNKDIEKLSTNFCNYVLNQQHFQIAMSDTGFIPKFIDDLLSPSTLTSYFDWGNQLFTKISQRNIAKIENSPSEWKDLDDICTSGISIGELERSGLIYLSNTNDEWYTIVMPFMLLKVLNNKLLVFNVEPVFQDNLLLIPTYETPWQWQNFELLYGHFQKALIDSLIYVQELRKNSVKHEIQLLKKYLEKQEDDNEQIIIEKQIDSKNQELDRQKRHNWQLSDIFRGALGANTLLQRKVQLHNLKVFTENKKFLVKTDDVASFDKSVLCDDNVIRSLEEGIFHCYQGNANIDHCWFLDSADNGKKLAIFSQIKYSERGVTTKISTPDIKDWYDITMKSVENYKNDYDVVLVLFTNR